MTFTGKREAFRVDVIARGLDHQRTTFLQAFGHHVANAATTFEAGAPVALNAAGEVIIHPGTDTRIFGVAKYNKTTALEANVSAEQIEFATNGSTATLKHPNISNLKITSDAAGATAYTVSTDYTVVAATGVITHVSLLSGGHIPLKTVVYAWYQYDLTAAELLADGQNFWNMQDDVSIQGGKVTVIAPMGAVVYTTRFHTGRVWAINDEVVAGSTSESAAGIFDRNADSTNNTVVGVVVQIPTADDPYLGIKLL